MQHANSTQKGSVFPKLSKKKLMYIEICLHNFQTVKLQKLDAIKAQKIKGGFIVTEASKLF